MRIPCPPESSLVAFTQAEGDKIGAAQALSVELDLDTLVRHRFVVRGQDLETDLVADIQRPVWMSDDIHLWGGLGRGAGGETERDEQKSKEDAAHG